MEKWQYMTVTLHFDPANDEWKVSGWDAAIPRGTDFGPVLDFWGDQGWEAVNITPVSVRFYEGGSGPHLAAAYADVYRVLFKRRRPWG